MTRKAAQGNRKTPKSQKKKAKIGPHTAVFSFIEFTPETYLGRKKKPKVPSKTIKNRS